MRSAILFGMLVTLFVAGMDFDREAYDELYLDGVILGWQLVAFSLTKRKL